MSMACAGATKSPVLLWDFSTSHLQNDVLGLLGRVHLKPISSSTAGGDVDDIEQITKALWGGHYFLNTQELFLLYHYLGLRFIKGNRTILFYSQPFPLDTETWD